MFSRRRSGPGAREALVLLVALGVAGALVWGAANLDDDGGSDLLPSGNGDAGAAPDDPAASEATASGWAPPTLAEVDGGIVDVAAATSTDLGPATLDLLVESAPVVVTTSTSEGVQATVAADLARDLQVPLLVTDATAPSGASSPGPSASPSVSDTGAATDAAPDAAGLLESWSTEHVVAVGAPPAAAATVHQVDVQTPASPTSGTSAAPSGSASSEQPEAADPVVTRPQQVEAMLADAEAAAPERSGADGIAVVVRPSGDAPDDGADDQSSGDDSGASPTATEAATDTGDGGDSGDGEGEGGAGDGKGVDPSALVGVPLDVRTNLEVLGVDPVPWTSADPRTDGELRRAMKDHDTTMLAIADDGWPDGPPRSTVTPDWPALFTITAQAPELVGGGLRLFPDRTFVAAYGNPNGPALGVLGERDVQGSIEYAKGLAEDYEGLFDHQVQPAFEIIATVASGEAGEDGDYSREENLDLITEWVDAATEAGVYVVLDLQPGRTDFLTQAKRLEDLLRRPNVGLALDPEWRLGPDQVHLEQIGSVTTEEVNEVADWLAGLVRDQVLPQKLLIIHNFRLSMTTNRENLDFHPELATMLHVDGQGAQWLKDDTWEVLTAAGPDQFWWGWKNFYDEDSPEIRSPEDTAAIEPTPHFISYQ